MRDPSERGAQLREAWRRSGERRNVLIATAIAVLTVVLFTVATVLWANATAPPYEEEDFRQTLFGVGAFFFSTYAAFFLLFIVRRQQHRAWYDRAVVLKAGIELQQAEAEAGEQDLGLAALWALTQRRLDYCHKIATSQAEKSFTYGVVAAGVGFLVLLATVIAAAASKSTAASAAAGVVGLAASGLSGYLGATFIRLHESSTEQLRAYFTQPLEFSRYLAAERLLGSLRRRAKEPATRDLIRALADEGQKS